MKLFFCDASKSEDRIYFISEYNNLIFSVYDGKLVLEACIPNGHANERAADSIVIIGDQLYISPLDSRLIWIYSLSQKTFRCIDCGIRGRFTVSQNTVYGNYVFFIGITVPYIIKMDMERESFEIIQDPYERILRMEDSKYPGRLLSRATIKDGTDLLDLSSRDNGLLRFNMTDCSFEWNEIGDDESKIFNGFVQKGSTLYLMHNNAEIDMLDEEKLVQVCSLGAKEKRANYFCPVKLGGNIWITTASDGISNIQIKDDGAILREDAKVRMIKPFNDGTYVVQYRNGQLAYYDSDSKIECTGEISSDTVENFIISHSDSCSVKAHKLNQEKEGFGLKTMIHDITKFGDCIYGAGN